MASEKWIVVVLAALPLWPQMVVDTVAGGKVRSGVPAQDVALGFIDGLAWDGDGSLVFCERSANLIRRLRPDGVLETVAGNGTTGFSGDGGAALEASLNGPARPCFDASGNLYFADTLNYRIRRIDRQGIIRSVAGSGVNLWQGLDREGPALLRSIGSIIDLAVGPGGSVYFTETDSPSIRRLTPEGRIEIVAASVSRPGLLAWDGAANLFVGDGGGSYASQIVRIAPDGTISRFAGYGPFNGVTVPDDEGKPAVDVFLYEVPAMAADQAGNLYIVQLQQPGPRNAPPNRIRRIDANGIISTVAGRGAVQSPYGLAVDQQGNIAYSESETTPSSVRGTVRLTRTGEEPRTLAGGSPKPAPDGTPARDAWLLSPAALAFNRAGELFIAESGACLIRKVGADGLLSTFAGTGRCGEARPGQPATAQDLSPPSSIAIDSRDRMFLLDTFGNPYFIAPDGKTTPAPFTPVLGPGGNVAVDARDRVYLGGMFSLVRILPDGTPQTIVSMPTQPGVPPPGFGPTLMRAMGVDPARNVYFTGTYLGSQGDFVFRVNDDGSFDKVYSGFFLNALSMAVDRRGAAWLAGGGVSVVDAAGARSIGVFGGSSGDGGPAQSARFDASAIALAPNGDLYLAGGNRIRKITGPGRAAKPVIAAGGIVNALSYAGGAIAPGELVSLFGSGFGVSSLQAAAPENGRLPWAVGRTRVYFDTAMGALAAVAPNQINVFVPYWLEPGKPVKVTVQVDDAVSDPVRLLVAGTAPGIAGTVLNQDGSLNSAARPADRGSIVTLFGTGEGRSYPQLGIGDFSISTPYSTPVAPVAVSIGGRVADIVYYGAAPFQPTGVSQINARIPAGVAPGSVAVSVSVGGVAARSVTIAVR